MGSSGSPRSLDIDRYILGCELATNHIVSKEKSRSKYREMQLRRFRLRSDPTESLVGEKPLYRT